MSQNLTDDILARLETAPDDAAFAVRTDGSWSDVSTAQFHREVTAVAKGLIAAGVSRGDRVALLSKTRYEWTLFDYAIWWTGAITVPIYETSSTDQISWILQDAGATAAIVETEEHRSRIGSALSRQWIIDQGATAELASAGETVDDATLETARSSVGLDSIATIIYTSGTTGRPKGCVLTHGNFDFEIAGALEALEPMFAPDDASTLLFLPLAHVFARIVQVGAVRSGARLAHTADVKDLVEHLGEVRPSFVLAVPRVFEKVFNSASQNAYASGKGKIFDLAADTAIEYSRALDSGKPGRFLRIKHGLFAKLVYGKITTALGGNVQYAVSGGAPLGERLAHFFRGIGVTIFEGYGLTETTAAIAVNRADALRIGTVGRAFPGTLLRISDTGEVCVKGGQVFAGYWRNEEATKEVFDDDGWLHTGDIGDLDEDGFLRITGRKKEIIVTAGGKNVAPAVLEERVRAHPLVSQVVVVGDGRPFIGALITVDQEDYAGDLDDPKLREALQLAIDDANKAVSRAESIRKFRIVRDDWTEENGYLTPSFKVKRNLVLADFHDQIEALYAG